MTLHRLHHILGWPLLALTAAAAVLLKVVAG